MQMSGAIDFEVLGGGLVSDINKPLSPYRYI